SRSSCSNPDRKWLRTDGDRLILEDVDEPAADFLEVAGAQIAVVDFGVDELHLRVGGRRVDARDRRGDAVDVAVPVPAAADGILRRGPRGVLDFAGHA